MFSTLDLRSGYWQVSVDPKDREKTAFVTPDGRYKDINDTKDVFAVIQVHELIFENGQKQIIHLAVTNLPSYPLILALWQATQLDKSTLFKNRLAINLWMTEERGWHSKRR